MAGYFKANKVEPKWIPFFTRSPPNPNVRIVKGMKTGRQTTFADKVSLFLFFFQGPVQKWIFCLLLFSCSFGCSSWRFNKSCGCNKTKADDITSPSWATRASADGKSGSTACGLINTLHMASLGCPFQHRNYYIFMRAARQRILRCACPWRACHKTMAYFNMSVDLLPLLVGVAPWSANGNMGK